jgi:phage tail-like protein
MEITAADYRVGNERENAPRKTTGTYKVPDVTFKRGVIGSEDLYEWFYQMRTGGVQDVLRTVTIQLQNEDHKTAVQEWKLMNARPIKYAGPSLNPKGTDVAIEELVLACERIELF